MKKRKREIKLKNVILILVIITFIITLTISIFNIVKWKMDSNKTNDEITNIQENVDVEKVQDTENTEIIEPSEKVPEGNPYWDYIKMDMINIDLNELKKINNEVKGWIKVNGTNINYPFVQTNNNSYYLTHSFNKKKNSAGWVFLDYRNNLNNDKNTIYYAHGRTDNTMFGSLKSILSKSWLKNKNNYIIKISTTTENSLWQIFSAYHIPTTSDYLTINFYNDNEYQTFLEKLISRSTYNFNTTVNTNDRIITLSTCYNDNEKMVVHAKLIKRTLK